MAFINCAEGTLAPFIPNPDKEWNKQRSIHLYRRIMLGANNQTTNEALNQSPESLVNKIVEDAAALPLAPEPEWAYWQIDDYSSDPDTRNGQIVDQVLGWARQWGIDIKNNGLRDRMSFFWHNHFVTRLEDYGCPSWMYQYHKLLQKYALGNFKEFVKEMGITPAMLVYLNNFQNTKFDINENYARELYELFTLGVDNGYTQMDIVETARAITGWSGLDVNNLCGEVEFVPFYWDNEDKTIFGQTGKWDYFDVIDILFDQRAVQISEHICTKLYSHFINPKIDEEYIKQLAQVFRDNDFELKPLLKTLFASDHFFEEANIGTVIPGHIEYFYIFLNEMGFPNDDDLNFNIVYGPSQFDQNIFNPVSVEGWQGNREWINSSTMPFRVSSLADIIGYYYQINGESVEFLRVWIKEVVGATTNNPRVITEKIIEYFLPKGLQFDYEVDEAEVVFKSEVPDFYYDLNLWNLDYEFAAVQTYYLILHITNLPEFQLK